MARSPLDDIAQMLAEQELAKKKQIQVAAASVPPSVAPESTAISQLLGLSAPQSMERGETSAILPAAISPKEFQAAQDLARSSPDLQDLKARLAEKEALYANPEFVGNTQTDLSPLMQFANVLSNKPKLDVSAYQRPGDAQDMVKTISGIKALISKEREGISDAERAYLKEALSGKKIVKDIFQEGSVSNKNGGSGTDKARTLRADFQKENDKLIKSVDFGNSLLRELKNPNWITSKTFPSKLAKAIQGGQISNLDVNTLSGPPDLVSKFRNTVSLMAEGEVSDQVKKDFENYAKQLVAANSQEVISKAQNYSNQYAPYRGFKPEEAMNIIGAGLYEKYVEDAKKEEQKKEEFLKKIEAINKKIGS